MIRRKEPMRMKMGSQLKRRKKRMRKGTMMRMF